MPAVIESVKNYKELGFSTIPIPFKTKAATIKWETFQDRRPTDEELKTLFPGNPTNVAIICGKVSGNLVVVDFDSEDRFWEWASVCQSKLDVDDIFEIIPVAKTSRGYHVYLRTQDAVKSVKFPNIDIKGIGGYVLAPPSIHPSGVEYTWVNPQLTIPYSVNSLEDIGININQKPQQDTVKGEPERNWVTEALKGVSEGLRNDTCMRLASHFMNTQPQDITEAICLEFAARCKPPLPESEVRTIVNSVYSRYTPKGIVSAGGYVDTGTLSEPKVSHLGGEYELIWETEGIKLDITGIEDNRNGLIAEVLITDIQNGHHIKRTRVNFLTMPNTALVNTLNSKISLDWERLFEMAGESIIRDYRVGEEFLSLSSVSPELERKYRLHPLIADGVPNLLFGDRANGKSYLMYLIALSVQTGIPMVGFQPIKGNVLILDNETSGEIAKRRINLIKRGMSITSLDEPFYRHCSRPLYKEISAIQKFVLEHDIKLVVVDSVGNACGGDTLTQEVVSRYFEALASLNVATLSLDHISKGEGTPTPYGSVYKQAAARMIWEVRGTQETGDNVLNMGIFNRKDNDGGLRQPFSLKLKFNGDDCRANSVVFSRQEIGDIADLAKGLTTKDRIVALLRYGSLPLEEIASQSDIPKSTVCTTLNRSKGKDFVKYANNEWGLKENATNTLS